MKHLLTFLLLNLYCSSAFGGANAAAPAPGAGGKYSLGAEVQFGYPMLTLQNPDGSNATYDGIAIHAGLIIPLLDTASFDINLNAGIKYLDLENLKNSSSQFEAANIIGPGAGLSIRYNKYLIGANYYQLWARHYSSGDFSGRVKYSLNPIEYYGGINYQFGRLGLSFLYIKTVGTIDKQKTGLEKNTPYDETTLSIQATFDMGETLLQVLQSLF